MNKKLISILAAILLLSPIGAPGAQAITTSDVNAVAPQMRTVLTNLSQTISLLNQRIANQNALMAGYAQVLASTSATLKGLSISATTTPQARAAIGSQLSQMTLEIMAVGNGVSAINAERIALGNIFRGITGTLRSLLTIIASAT